MTNREYNILMIVSSLAGWAVGMVIGVIIIKAVTRYCGV